METIRNICSVVGAYVLVCAGMWTYVCIKYQQLFLDVTMQQFLFGWWHWFA